MLYTLKFTKLPNSPIFNHKIHFNMSTTKFNCNFYYINFPKEILKQCINQVSDTIHTHAFKDFLFREFPNQNA